MSNSLFDPLPRYDVRKFAGIVTADFIDNYLTVSKFAEHQGISEENARQLLGVLKAINNSIHPDA